MAVTGSEGTPSDSLTPPLPSSALTQLQAEEAGAAAGVGAQPSTGDGSSRSSSSEPASGGTGAASGSPPGDGEAGSSLQGALEANAAKGESSAQGSGSGPSDGKSAGNHSGDEGSSSTGAEVAAKGGGADVVAGEGSPAGNGAAKRGDESKTPLQSTTPDGEGSAPHDAVVRANVMPRLTRHGSRGHGISEGHRLAFIGIRRSDDVSGRMLWRHHQLVAPCAAF